MADNTQVVGPIMGSGPKMTFRHRSIHYVFIHPTVRLKDQVVCKMLKNDFEENSWWF